MPLKHIKAVIFDLDGVIVSTDECHYLAWKQIAVNEDIPFNRQDNERLRGVSRMESLEILLEKARVGYTDAQKAIMADKKNNVYKQLIAKLTPNDLLPGARETLERLKADGIKVAIGTVSKNAPAILKYIGLEGFFDAVADGSQISRGKPDPEVFLLAARLLGVPPVNCLVVEDAAAGILAAVNGGMCSLGVGSAAAHPKASLSARSLNDIHLSEIIKCEEV
jgi:beta-phosphoglucomutase